MTERLTDEMLAPSVEVVGAIGGLTLGTEGNGDDHLRYSLFPSKPSVEVTFDAAPMSASPEGPAAV